MAINLSDYLIYFILMECNGLNSELLYSFGAGYSLYGALLSQCVCSSYNTVILVLPGDSQRETAFPYY